MKVGDLVHEIYDDGSLYMTGIVIEVINSEYTVPPVCKVMWSTGEIEKQWTDDIAVVP